MEGTNARPRDQQQRSPDRVKRNPGTQSPGFPSGLRYFGHIGLNKSRLATCRFYTANVFRSPEGSHTRL